MLIGVLQAQYGICLQGDVQGAGGSQGHPDGRTLVPLEIHIAGFSPFTASGRCNLAAHDKIAVDADVRINTRPRHRDAGYIGRHFLSPIGP